MVRFVFHIGVGRFRILGGGGGGEGGPRFRILGGGGGANSQQAHDIVTTFIIILPFNLVQLSFFPVSHRN